MNNQDDFEVLPIPYGFFLQKLRFIRDKHMPPFFLNLSKGLDSYMLSDYDRAIIPATVFDMTFRLVLAFDSVRKMCSLYFQIVKMPTGVRYNSLRVQVAFREQYISPAPILVPLVAIEDVKQLDRLTKLAQAPSFPWVHNPTHTAEVKVFIAFTVEQAQNPQDDSIFRLPNVLKSSGYLYDLPPPSADVIKSGGSKGSDLVRLKYPKYAQAAGIMPYHSENVPATTDALFWMDDSDQGQTIVHGNAWVHREVINSLLRSQHLTKVDTANLKSNCKSSVYLSAIQAEVLRDLLNFASNGRFIRDDDIGALHQIYTLAQSVGLSSAAQYATQSIGALIDSSSLGALFEVLCRYQAEDFPYTETIMTRFIRQHDSLKKDNPALWTAFCTSFKDKFESLCAKLDLTM